MSRRTSWFAWLLCCTACAGTRQAATTPVIVAGSVCSELPQLQPFAAPAADSGTTDALVAFVTTQPADTLGIYDMRAARLRFSVPIALRSRPQLLSDLVVSVDTKGALVAFDLATGALRFRAPVARESWLGAVQVGSVLISTSSSLSFRPGERGSTLSALDAATGRQVWQREVPYAISRAVAVGARVFVISDHADVWELDARSGRDVGCARTGAGPLDWLDADATGLWLGARDAQRLPTNAQPAARVTLPISQLPGQPALRGSSYDAVPAVRSAHGRVGVISALSASAARPFGEHYAFGFYRELFGYRSDGELIWARLLDSDLVRAQLVGTQLIVLTEDGVVRQFSADTGLELRQLALPGKITSADIRAHALPELPSSEPARPLRNALAEIALDTDARLLPGRLLAVTALAALPVAEASADLLHIYAQPGAPAALRARVVALLPTRHVGGEFLVDALLDDYDFLEDRSPPPLAAIVPSLIALHETRAVPRLVERLFDPDTQLDDLEGLVNAIAILGADSAVPPLSRFVAMYHSDSSLAGNPAALVAAARALLAHGGADAAKLVQALASAPITLPSVRAALAELLAPPAVDAPASIAAPAPLAAAEVTAPVLSDEAVKRVFAEHAEELRRCVLSELGRNPLLHQLRLSFVVRSDGSMTGLQVLPDHSELVQCLKTQLVTLRFPAFQGARRLANYSVAVHSDALASVLSPSKSEVAERPFWKLAELRAGPGVPQLNVTPWWQNQNPLFVSVDEVGPQPPNATTTPPSTAAVSPVAPGAEPATTPRQPQPARAVDQWWLPSAQP